MAIRHLSHRTSLLALRGELIYTLNQLKAHPLTQRFVPTFEPLREAWTEVFAEELAQRDALASANARVVSADVTLNSLASRVSKNLLTVVEDDRTHPLYVAFFKKKTLSELIRPTLGSQLDAMRCWIQPLTTSDVPALAQLGLEVQAAVAVADEVVAFRGQIEAEATFFREVGNRKRLFDRVNGVRKAMHGELARMPHENMGVPAGLADQFFRHESSKDEAEEPTPETLDEEISTLQAQLAAKQELRASLQAEAERAAAEETARLAEIAELERVAAEGEKKAAEARARLAKLST